MTSMPQPFLNLPLVSHPAPNPTLPEGEWKALAGLGLLADLDGQLTQIGTRLEQSLAEKQNLRKKIEEINNLRTQNPILEIDGQAYHSLNPEEASSLQVIPLAITQVDEKGRVTGYLLDEDNFQEATRNTSQFLENKLSGLNDNGEITMLKIQSLVEQRKNTLTLLSNLSAAADQAAKNIIGNIRN